MSDDETTALVSADARLCYVSRHGCAYFTTRDIADQIGDDWNDVPYEHNAGDPYPWDPAALRKEPRYSLWRVDFLCGHLLAPCEAGRRWAEGWSVDDINTGVIAWLQSPTHRPLGERVRVYAGDSFSVFARAVGLEGGRVESVEQVRHWRDDGS